MKKALQVLVFTTFIISSFPFGALATGIFDQLKVTPHSNYIIDVAVDDRLLLEPIFDHTTLLQPNSFSIVSHARPGEIWFNRRWVSGKNLVALLKTVVPRNTKHLLIWGCNFGKGQAGRNAIESIEKELQVTVSASDDITGKNGNWLLERGQVDLSNLLSNYPHSLQCDPLCINNEKVVGGVADFESSSLLTDRLGNTRELAGAGVGRYEVLTYGNTTGSGADVTINASWGNSSIKPQNGGLKYLGGNDITGGESYVRTNPLVSTTPYLDFTGATQFCFDYFDASIDGSDRSKGFDITIYHSGSPNNHVYNIDLTKVSGDPTNAGGVTYSLSSQTAWATLNGVNPITNPTTTEWSVKPGWVRLCIPVSGFNLAQIRGIQIHTEGINNGVSDQEKWGLDNVAFSVSCSNPCAMPVTIVNFAARQEAEGTLLEWKTVQESKFDRFEVEQSERPELGFKKIAEIKGGQSSYSHLDANSSGLGYYRLKMIDLDGTYNYSRIIAVTTWKGAELYRIYPNPTRGSSISINSIAAVESFNITSISGTPIKAQRTAQHNGYRFDMEQDLPKGIYIITYKVANRTFTQQFVVDK